MKSLNILTTCIIHVISLFILLHAFCMAYWYPGSLSKFSSVDNSGNDIHQTVTLTCHISTHLIWLNMKLSNRAVHLFQLDWILENSDFCRHIPPPPFLKSSERFYSERCVTLQQYDAFIDSPSLHASQTRSYTYRKSLVRLDSKEKQESI